MAPAFGRIASALTLRSIAGKPKARTWLLYFIIFEQFVSNVVCFMLILVQCTPVERLWDKLVAGHCWFLSVQEYEGYFQGGRSPDTDTSRIFLLTMESALNSLTDLCLAVFPAIIVWNLNMKTSLKISLIIILSLGLFAMAASIVKTIMINMLGTSNDYTYNLVI